MSRDLFGALIISLSLHIFAMSVFGISMPQIKPEQKQLVKMNFLGPVLKKNAFGIMMEGALPTAISAYQMLPRESYPDALKVKAPIVSGGPGVGLVIPEVKDNEETLPKELKEKKALPNYMLEGSDEAISSNRRVSS
ncbi:MAG: hypothetical protein HQL28_00095 [Candidatus Omnitrophica bacterium]|nr:hypothetical protein [Candidatus Omnitrophota bacterium]